jgi:hypothetical protein
LQVSDNFWLVGLGRVYAGLLFCVPRYDVIEWLVSDYLLFHVCSLVSLCPKLIKR